MKTSGGELLVGNPSIRGKSLVARSIERSSSRILEANIEPNERRCRYGISWDRRRLVERDTKRQIPRIAATKPEFLALGMLSTRALIARAEAAEASAGSLS